MTFDERWMPVRGFEGLYEVSSLGRLKSFKVDPKGQIRKTAGGYIWRFESEVMPCEI